MSAFADPLDQAAEQSLRFLNDSLRAHRRRTRVEPPRIAPTGVRLCRRCDESISSARLAAVPHATRCVDCQQRHEDRARHSRA